MIFFFFFWSILRNGSSAVKESTCNAGDPGSIPGLGRSAGEGIGYLFEYSWASLVAQLVKNPPAMRETWVWSLDWEDSLEKTMATHSSILARRIPGTVQSMGSQRDRHDWATFTFTFQCRWCRLDPLVGELKIAMVFPVVMYGCESWTIKIPEHRRIYAFELWCWRTLLIVPWTARRSNQSILKEISPEYSLEGLMLKFEYFGHLMRRTDSLEDSDAGKDWKQEEKGMTEDEMAGWHHRLSGHEFE